MSTRRRHRIARNRLNALVQAAYASNSLRAALQPAAHAVCLSNAANTGIMYKNCPGNCTLYSCTSVWCTDGIGNPVDGRCAPWSALLLKRAPSTGRSVG